LPAWPWALWPAAAVVLVVLPPLLDDEPPQATSAIEAPATARTDMGVARRGMGCQ
jgi:hypothetical protein